MKLTRKRTTNKEEWARNKRQKACQSGKAYVNAKGKLIPPETIKSKKDCKNSCKFKCAEKINAGVREQIFEGFCKMDANQKRNYIAQTSVAVPVSGRKTRGDENLVKGTEKKSSSYSF